MLISDIKEEYEHTGSESRRTELLGIMRFLRTLRVGSIVKWSDGDKDSNYVVVHIYDDKKYVDIVEQAYLVNKRVPVKQLEVIG